ncbi:uncharacterized protein [Lolium perenne]|uniref:uncharacterized protein n=1 Tax=Lolium perenne TaxID=4522 RepID=UPI003A99E168
MGFSDQRFHGSNSCLTIASNIQGVVTISTAKRETRRSRGDHLAMERVVLGRWGGPFLHDSAMIPLFWSLQVRRMAAARSPAAGFIEDLRFTFKDDAAYHLHVP